MERPRPVRRPLALSVCLLLCAAAVAPTTVAVPATAAPPRRPPPETRGESLDVRDAPTAGVFALMFGRVMVADDLPPFVTLRVSGGAMELPPPERPSGYGDYLPIGGWIKGLQDRLGVGALVVGFEREGGTFHLRRRQDPAGKTPPWTNGAGGGGASAPTDYESLDDYAPPEKRWRRVRTGPGGVGPPHTPPPGIPPSRFRLAGVHWATHGGERAALLVATAADGTSYMRVAREGEPLGRGGLTVGRIAPASVVLRRTAAPGRTPERLLLVLRGVRGH